MRVSQATVAQRLVIKFHLMFVKEQGKGIALVVTIEARGKDDSGGDGDVGETEEELERRACEEEEALQL